MLHFIGEPWKRHLRLDIVGFLAILGEASILANAQVTFLSPASFLPRLVPAPQALIKTRRADKLDTVPGQAIGCKSGNIRQVINYFAHIVHEGSKLGPYEVRSLRISKENEKDSLDTIQVRRWGPVTYLAIASFCLFIALLVLSICLHDGMALIATLLLGTLTSLIQCGSWNELHFPRYKELRRPLPSSDLVVHYPNGSFIAVECTEEIARKLYFGVEYCKYKVTEGKYRVIALSSTLILMFAVISLGNAGKEMQLTFAASYLILNAAYWLVAALPEKTHWDTSAFRVDEKMKPYKAPRFTDALWATIAITGTVDWVLISNIAPQTNPWKQWVLEAETEVSKEMATYADDELVLPDWNAQAALTRLLAASASGDAASPADERPMQRLTTEERDRRDNINSATFETMAMQSDGIPRPLRRTPTI